MYKTVRLLIIAWATFMCLDMQAQTAGVKLLSSPRPDSIMLRWAPTDAQTWRLGNAYGYQVKRYTVLKNKKIPKEIPETLLTPTPLRPAAIEQWQPLADNRYAAIAAECIYGSFYKGAPTGNSPHLAYKKYQEELHRFSFALYAADQSVQVAAMSGLYWVDKTARNDEKYLYKVFIPCPDSLAVDTASSFTGISEYVPLPKPLDLKAEWDNQKVTLSWNIRFLNHIYNSYVVEKSADGGSSFTRISDNGTVQLADAGVSPERMYKTDSLPDNRTTFYYRVRGINAFGETGPPTDSISGTGLLPISDAPVIVDNQVIDNRRVLLRWEYPAEMNPYITGFKIYRSPKPTGRKQLVLKGEDPSQRAFTDTTPAMTNYYLISVYNRQKEKLSPIVTYAERVDSFPPMAPVNLAGTIDSLGHVTLNWKPNHDDDLIGYRVYLSNHPDFEYILVTPGVIKDTTYHDSINIHTLTRQIFYKVKAIDARQNQSPFSEQLTLTRPDVIPPVAPVIKEIADEKGKPRLQWLNSPSTDVVAHLLYRKTISDTAFVKLVRLNKPDGSRTIYTDESALPGHAYVYQVVAQDEHALLSPPSNSCYFKMPSDVVENIKLKKRLLTDQVQLSWVIKTDKKVKRILVYRSVDNGSLRLYDNTTEGTYTDRRLSPGKTYHYAVKAVYDDESTSLLSEKVVVRM
jgi:fibronectin type 3 domain-containing protein